MGTNKENRRWKQSVFLFNKYYNKGKKMHAWKSVHFFIANSGAAADMSAVFAMQDSITGLFNINPILLLPPVIVIVAVAMKMPAIPGINNRINLSVIQRYNA